jgi:hypothetical protein
MLLYNKDNLPQVTAIGLAMGCCERVGLRGGFFRQGGGFMSATRAAFGEYLARWGRGLQLQLQDVGPLAGLPLELQDALDVADGMRLLDQSAPSEEEVRDWYRMVGKTTSHSPESRAMKVYASLNGLRETDLASLDQGELLLFAVRCSNWASLARQQLGIRRYGGPRVIGRQFPPELASSG